MKNKIYCAYVNKGLRVNFLERNSKSTFRTTPCCHLHKDLIPDEPKKFIPLINADSITEHPALDFFKDAFKDGEFHPSCKSCIDAEAAGLESVRQKLNDLEHAESEYDYLKLDVVMSNKCNLACPFCSQGSSSLIQTIAQKYDTDELPEHWKKGTEPQVETQTIGETCAELLKKYKIHTFKIIGGEPLLKENWEPIGKVLDEDYCRDLNLEITSNGTIMNADIIRRLSKAKHTKLRISVDSIGTNYDFIRWPHSWGKMKKNLLYLRDNKPDNCDVQISILVNILNFEFLPDIEKFFAEENIYPGFDFTLKPSNSPLQWTNLPDNIIDYVYNNVTDESIKNPILNRNAAKRDIRDIIKDIEFYLTQRGMKSQDVLAPMTRKWLCL
jgi:sulfatase maturation enzyme AslB (radical SAM superfamily)